MSAINVNNVWTNILDDKTGESVNFEGVTDWWDGTPMDDSKADGVIYRKLPSSVGGGYVKRVFPDGLVNVKWFGAVGDGVTDDTLAIQSAIDVAEALKETNISIYFPHSRGYLTTDTITVGANLSVIMEAPIYYNGDHSSAAMVIGDPNVRTTRKTFRLAVTAVSNYSTWEEDASDDVGIRLINLYANEIQIDRADYFRTGVHCFGDNSNGFVYNNVYLGQILNSQYGLVLDSDNSGWCNENNFYGGRIHNSRFAPGTSNPIYNGKSRYGIVIRSGDGYRQNGNSFWKPSIELRESDAQVDNPSGEAVAILIERGRYNHFYSVRDETNTKTVRTLNDSVNNKVEVSFTSANGAYSERVDDAGDHPTTRYTSSLGSNYQSPGHLVYDSGLLINNIYPASDIFGRRNNLFFQLKDSSSTLSAIPTSAGLSVSGNFLSIPQNVGVGVQLDTRFVKRFKMGLNIDEIGDGGRIYIVARAANGSRLTGENPKHVKTGNIYSTGYSASSFGGSYGITGTLTRDPSTIMVDFEVSDDCAWIQVILSSASEDPMVIRSFQIYSIDGITSIRPIFTQSTLKTAQSAPNHGDATAGDLIINSSSTTTFGYKCIASGNPGTWVRVPILTPAEAQADSEAEDVAELVADFNALLAKLRTAGLMDT